MTDDPFERAVERAEAAHRQEEAERRARRAERWASGQRKGFRIHATVFVAVQVLLIAIWGLVWATAGAHYPWFIFPLLGWGVGLADHYAVVREHLTRKPR
jgi:hypothetical protein